MNEDELNTRLRGMIGQAVYLSGQPCRVIEFLEREMNLVLQPLVGDKAIQGNQFGEARRRVLETITVPVLQEGMPSTVFRSLVPVDDRTG